MDVLKFFFSLALFTALFTFGALRYNCASSAANSKAGLEVVSEKACCSGMVKKAKAEKTKSCCADMKKAKTEKNKSCCADMKAKHKTEGECHTKKSQGRNG